MGKRYSTTTSRLPALWVAATLAIPLASTASAKPSAAAEVGDFAPMAAGNTWTYQGEETMLCKALYDVITVRRVISVDSSRPNTGGVTHFLSYRDSIHWTTYRRWTPTGGKREDTVRTGRFLVREKSGQRELRVGPSGTGNVPSEMEFFFRSHTYPADRIMPDSAGTMTGGEVRYRRTISKTVFDDAGYGKDIGMTRLYHLYNVWNTNNMTAPERIVSYRLVAFNGTAVITGSAETFGVMDIPGDALSPKDFAPVALDYSWIYLGIRRVDSAGTVSRDSMYRVITVKSSSAGIFTLTLKDSLYARLRADKPLDPVIKTVDFRVSSGGVALANGSAGIGIWEADSDPSWSDPLRFFNGKRYPARDVEEMAFPDGPRSVVAYAEKSPGILVDTTVYAEGVGLVRRAKILDEGRVYTEEFRLIEFQGKSIQAIPVSLAPPAASARQRVINGSEPARLPVRSWRGRDAAGKEVKPALPFTD
ncbi:MAG: hypothetical protein ABI036_00970 [Fibrobacteria bacterium]